MRKAGTSVSNHSRRQILATIAGATSLAVAPTVASAARAVDLHDTAAQHAKKLAAGKVSALRLLLPQGSGDNVRPVIAAFRDATGIAVTLVETPVDDINTQLALDAMSGEGNYDLALPATFGLPDLATSGAIIPITEFARKYEPHGFRKGILYDIGDRFDGELYGFQTDGDTYVMFYHKDLLENPDEAARYADTYGRSLAVPDTWEELDRQMAYFHRKDQGISGGLLFRTPGYLAWEWWVRFHAKGVWPLSSNLDPQIDSDAGVEALENMIRATEYLCPEVDRLGLFENWARYGKGDVYCNIGWGGSQKYLNGPKSKMRGRMAYGPTPGGLVNESLLITPYFNWGWNYVVTANSKNREIAYLFALFASSPAMSTLAVRQQGGYFDPFRPEHYGDRKIREIYSDDFLKVHEASLRSSIPDLYLANQSEYFQALTNWLDRALLKKVSPTEALKRVAQQWRLINRNSGFEKQKRRWSQLRQKYPPHVRDRLRDIR